MLMIDVYFIPLSGESIFHHDYGYRPYYRANIAVDDGDVTHR